MSKRPMYAPADCLARFPRLDVYADHVCNPFLPHAVEFEAAIRKSTLHQYFHRHPLIGRRYRRVSRSLPHVDGVDENGVPQVLDIGRGGRWVQRRPMVEAGFVGPGHEAVARSPAET